VLAAARATLANDIVVNTRTKLTIGAVVIVMGAVLVWKLRDRGRPPEAASDAATVSPSPPPEPVVAAGDATAKRAAIDAGTRAFLSARWGSGSGELGRDRPQEGNAEGPMSLAPAAGGLVILDQVNGRIARYDDKGRLERTMDVPRTTQDVAVAKNGAIAALDRLAEKKITVLDPFGRKTGELPLTGRRVGEGGLVTGVFVDGKDVYVEKEHGALVHVGTIDGTPADETKELTGRPSRDGSLLLTAGLSSPSSGMAFLNALDRKTSALRFARSIPFPRPAHAIVLLDSDARGGIYLGVAAGPDRAAHVACLDAGDGHVIGRVVLPLSDVPEESFRDFAVADDGTILFALRSEQGVEVRTARCP
jgi:hypothetical protein